jgi:hypothetical protein
MSRTVESYVPIVTVSASLTPARERVKVLSESDVFTTTIFVTTVVVADGTVYRVVVVVVVAAPRNKVFDTVAISYYLQ